MIHSIRSFFLEPSCDDLHKVLVVFYMLRSVLLINLRMCVTLIVKVSESGTMHDFHYKDCTVRLVL